MKKTMALTTTAILLAAGLSLPLPPAAFAHGYPEWGHADRGCSRFERPKRGKWMAQILGLSDKQQQQIQQIRQEERPKLKPLYRRLEEQRRQLRKAASAQTFDEKQIRALAAEQAATRTELTVIRARMHHRIQMVLTPEQRALAARLRPLLAKRHGHRGHRRFMPPAETPRS